MTERLCADQGSKLDRDGACRLSGALSLTELDALGRLLCGTEPERPGVRLTEIAGLDRLLARSGVVGAIAGSILGDETSPVRAVMFDKSARTNWTLGWHQDRTIVVKRRIDTPGFGPWSVKRGLHHVAPPPDLLARMLTLRIHLDPVDADNAPLMIAPGSHRCGRIPIAEIDRIVAQCGVQTCLAEAGDVWVYSTPIVHASDGAATPRHRRVLQVDYAAFDLPGGLEWRGL